MPTDDVPPNPPNLDPAANADRLAVLLREIKNAKENIKRRSLAMAEEYLRIGRSLIEIKEIVGHGRFGWYLDQHCAVKHRQANYYMRAVQFGFTPHDIWERGLTGAKDYVESMINAGGRRRSPSIPKGKPKSKPTKVDTELQRPTDRQVLRVVWRVPDKENRWVLMYIWRDAKLLDVTKSFNFIRLEYVTRHDDPGVPGTSSLFEWDYIQDVYPQVNSNWETWDDVAGRVQAYDRNYKRHIPDWAEVYEGSREAEIWDSGSTYSETDVTTLTMLREWRYCILILGGKEYMERALKRREEANAAYKAAYEKRYAAVDRKAALNRKAG